LVIQQLITHLCKDPGRKTGTLAVLYTPNFCFDRTTDQEHRNPKLLQATIQQRLLYGKQFLSKKSSDSKKNLSLSERQAKNLAGMAADILLTSRGLVGIIGSLVFDGYLPDFFEYCEHCLCKAKSRL